jgi:hypothetical protein
MQQLPLGHSRMSVSVNLWAPSMLFLQGTF